MAGDVRFCRWTKMAFVTLIMFTISMTVQICGQGLSSSTSSYDIETPSSLVTLHVAAGNTTSAPNSTNVTSSATALPTTAYPWSMTTRADLTEECLGYEGSCQDLGGDCIDCDYDYSCVYGREYNITCRPKPDVECMGNKTLVKVSRCRYCYQSEPWEQTCTPATKCNVHSNPPKMLKVECAVKDNVTCLGYRQFYRLNRCNWTSGYRWTTALTLSITLGGFGADRFYLGSWKEGLGKLFSFGGLGVWTLVDVVLIAVGYVGPEDGSHYI